MKMTKKQVFHLLFGFAVMAAAGYGVWRLVLFFALKITQINPSVAVAIIGAMATVCVGIAAVIITQRQTKARELEEAHRGKKAEIYNDFLDIVTRIIKGFSDEFASEKPSSAELVGSMLEYKRQILLWGSPKVIKAQLQYEEAVATGGNAFLTLDNLYRAIRDDIGLSNKGLDRFDLIKLFLKDAYLMNEFLQAGGKASIEVDKDSRN